MNLLSPDDIKKDKSASAEQAKQRSHALATEESRLVQAVNLARADADREIKGIENEVKVFKEKKEAEKTQLQGEVESLKAQKAELLKPIDEIKRVAEETLRTAESTLANAEAKEKDVEAHREKNIERAEQLQEVADQQGLTAKKLEKREQAVKDEEARSNASADALATKWTEYHKAVADLNQKIRKYNADKSILDAETEANQIKQKQLEQDRQEIEKDRKTIKSQYEALERARIQILGY